MPLQNQLHVDTLLSNVAVKYRSALYIADQVFPDVAVKKTSDIFRVYTRNWRIPSTLRSSGGVSKEWSFDVSTAGYQLEWHSQKAYVADRDADNYDLADLRVDTTEELTDVLLRRKELMVANLFTVTNWSQNVSLAAANAFSANTTVSNPIPIFDTAATTIIQNSGQKPNYGILPRNGFVSCKNHTSVLDRTKYVSAEMDVKMLQALFGLEQLLVPMAAQDTSAFGLTDVVANIWGDNAFVGYKPGSASNMKPSAGYVFKYSRPMTKRWREEEWEADAIEVNLEIQPRVVASLCGYLIRDID